MLLDDFERFLLLVRDIPRIVDSFKQAQIRFRAFPMNSFHLNGLFHLVGFVPLPRVLAFHLLNGRDPTTRRRYHRPCGQFSRAFRLVRDVLERWFCFFRCAILTIRHRRVRWGRGRYSPNGHLRAFIVFQVSFTIRFQFVRFVSLFLGYAGH